MGGEKFTWRALHLLYNGLLITATFFLLPLIVYSVTATAKRRHTFLQRMGWCRYRWQKTGVQDVTGCIWVHALSVGEVRAAHSMVVRLRRLHPDVRICFSASTYTGFQTAEQLFGHQERIELAYFPYDWIWAVRNVASKVNPSIVILTETDIWPNFLMEMHRRHVPVCLVNLQLSENSWKNYRRFKALARIIFLGFEKITVQGHNDLKRLTLLGIPSEKVAVTGNIKFDSITPVAMVDSVTQWQRNLGIAPGRRVLIAGSTHEGEEKVLLEVLKSLMPMDDAPVLILAPRDPLRSPEILKCCRNRGLSGGLLSVLSKEGAGTGCPQVVVVDSIGVLKVLYNLADIVFVGGSLVPCGGHNPLEPAAWGKPIIFGPDMRDFLLISELLLKARAALRVANADELGVCLKKLLTDPLSAEKMGQRALRVFSSRQGAIDKTLEFLGLVPCSGKGQNVKK